MPGGETRDIGLDAVDVERARAMVSFVRTHGTRQVLDALLSPALPDRLRESLIRHCRFCHGALLVFPDHVDQTLMGLSSWGLAPGRPFPSVVVGDRLCRRHTLRPDSLEVRIVHAAVRGDDGQMRDIEIFLLPSRPEGPFHRIAADERRHNHETHFAFEVASPDEVTLSGLREVLLRSCGMTCDGGGFTPHRGASLFYFKSQGVVAPQRWPLRLELMARGRFSRLLSRHLQSSQTHARGAAADAAPRPWGAAVRVDTGAVGSASRQTDARGA